MKIYHILANLTATAATALLAASAFAADSATEHKHTPATQATCDSLASQFNTSWSAHQNDKNAQEAKVDRDAGEKSCKDAKFDQGARQLHKALRELGVRPVHNTSTAISKDSKGAMMKSATSKKDTITK
jgi:hypothetical protein